MPKGSWSVAANDAELSSGRALMRSMMLWIAGGYRRNQLLPVTRCLMSIEPKRATV
jgi:hypothetical protein